MSNMLNRHSNYCLSLILSTSLLLQTTGCHLLKTTSISELKSNEHVLCSGYPTSDVVNDQRINFNVSIYQPDRTTVNAPLSSDDVDLVARIEAQTFSDREKNKTPFFLGSQFTKGNRFSFRDITWEILGLGVDGVKVGGEQWCEKGFIHVKHVK